MEGFGFYEIVVSLKASRSRIPLRHTQVERGMRISPHWGGPQPVPLLAAVKSAVAIGALLLEDVYNKGIAYRRAKAKKSGSTVLSWRPWFEVFRYQIVSCPTCGRCEVTS
jgi:4-hydroxy-3-methylbut-2-en-1-yl diphosphate synthase IspG/GcpE